jgi:hypothetical protein
MAVTNAVSWRMEGIKYKKNEASFTCGLWCSSYYLVTCLHHVGANDVKSSLMYLVCTLADKVTAIDNILDFDLQEMVVSCTPGVSRCSWKCQHFG